VQYILSLIDRWTSPAKQASAAGAGLAGSLNAAGVAAGKVDASAQKNAASIRTLYSELSKAETEVKQLESAQKRLGAGGSSDIAQKRMLDEKLEKARGKVGAINSSIVQSGGANFDIKGYDDAEKKKRDSAKKTAAEEKKAQNDAKKNADKTAKEKSNFLSKQAATTNGILAAGAKTALAGVGLSGVTAFMQLGLGFQGMARLNGITARAQYNMRGLFKGTDSKPLLDSLDRMVGMLSPATNTGKALGSILRGSFNAIGKAVEYITPFAERFFAGMILGAGAARVALTYISAKIVGFIATVPGAAALLSKFGTGWGPFAAGAMVAATALGFVAIKAALAMAPIIALGVAMAVLYSGIKDVTEAWKEWQGVQEDQAKVKKSAAPKELMALPPEARKYLNAKKPGDKTESAPTQAAPVAVPPVKPAESKAAGVNIGQQLGAGMVAGMRQVMPDVKDAGAQLSKSAESGAKDAAQIHSPSDLMRKSIGWNLGFGVRDGLLQTKGSVQAAAESALVPDVDVSAKVPQMSTSGQGGSSSGRTLLIDCRGAIFYGLDGASGFVQMIRATVSDQFEEVREQVGALAELATG
jgi:hypothetical protein